MIKDPSSLYIYIYQQSEETTATIAEREGGRGERPGSWTSFGIREAVFYERIFGKPASLSASHEFLIPDAIPLFTRKGLCPRLSSPPRSFLEQALLLTRSIGNFQTVIAYLKGADKYFRERNRWNFLRPGERSRDIIFSLSLSSPSSKRFNRVFSNDWRVAKNFSVARKIGNYFADTVASLYYSL